MMQYLGQRKFAMFSYKEEIEKKISDFESNKLFFVKEFLDITSYVTARKTLNRIVNERVYFILRTYYT